MVAIMSATVPEKSSSCCSNVRGSPTCSWHTTPTTRPPKMMGASSMDTMP
jgi:hypothetical protein